MDRNICDDIRRIGPEVALLAEGVDRNSLQVNFGWSDKVALLAEGVDRNNQDNTLADTLIVALLAEGVDRNACKGAEDRRNPAVALLAEGVDRNAAELDIAIAAHKSPSSRRAWIEMLLVQINCRASSSRPPRGGRG